MAETSKKPLEQIPPLAPPPPANLPAPEPAPASPAPAQAAATQFNPATASELSPARANSDSIDRMLTEAVALGASDLHLRMHIPPMIRINGTIRPLPNWPALSEPMIRELFAPLLSKKDSQIYAEERSIDTSYGIKGVARFRVALFFQQNMFGGVLRQIPEDIPTLEDLKAPRILREFADMPRGLVLITGPTGSGKSTTLAAIVDHINRNRHDHILTIEDPVEFVHQPKQCIVNHREVGRDTPSFAKGLKDALRQDPDVILVGEMRDYETISLGLTAAETGHLVFATLHTSSAPSSIDRLVGAIPAGEQAQARMMLAGSLVGIVTQTLMPTIDGKGRIAAHEILVANNAVRAMIRREKTVGMRNELQTKIDEGMQTLDRALAYYVSIGQISEDEARRKSQELSEFDNSMVAIREGRGIKPPDLLGDDLAEAQSTVDK